MIYAYTSYGLDLALNTSLPPLSSSPTTPSPFQVCIEIGVELPPWADRVRGLSRSAHCTRPNPLQTADQSNFVLTVLGTNEFFELAYGDGARFLIDGAAERVWASSPPGYTIEDLTTYLVGPVMGFILRRRGVIALHASAVCVGGHAVVLCGGSASGKSTTAAALGLRGIPVLSDDVTALSGGDGESHVEAGYPRVCLWPSAVQELLGAPDALPRLTPTWDKCFLPLDGVHARFEPERQPLGAIYLLALRMEQDDAPRVQEVGTRDVLLELVQNTYMNWLLDKTQRAAEFEVLGRLVAQVPVRRIIPHRDPARIGALCDLIIQDAQRLFDAKPAVAQVSGA